MSRLRERLLSDKNIFLSIYFLESYIQNKELLSPKEREELCSLKDIFNSNKVNNTVKKVRSKLKEILNDENKYFETKVFFKPKDIDGKGKNIFRPLHTESLIEQIAMTAMLQVLVYDIDNETGKLVPSELSKLLPSNFYGNRISFDGIQLFKPWQEQYREYTSKANDMLYTYSQTLEYMYEVSLDLENFFPSINPKILFSFIIERLPLKYLRDEKDKENETKFLHTILKKLLFFRLSPLNPTEISWYIKSNNFNINQEKSNLKYTKGMPQGLPHTYFMAKIFMLIIKKTYTKFFPGEMLFYVDDSVIFTNGKNGVITEEIFVDHVNDINKEIKEIEEGFLDNNMLESILPLDYCYDDDNYGVKLHPAELNKSKNVFSPIPDAKKDSGELYLKSLSRETSNIGFDIYTIFSDEEEKMILNRTTTILDAINQEIEKIDKNDLSKKIYREKLIRYRKFFSYRKTILDYKNTGDTEELMNSVLAEINLRSDSKALSTFFDKYTDDILAANIHLVFKRCTVESKKPKKLIKAVKELSKKLYKGNEKHSYILQSYRQYLENKPEFLIVDYYCTLKNKVALKFNYLRVQSEIQKLIWLQEDLGTLWIGYT